jgi:hypothetical protein
LTSPQTHNPARTYFDAPETHPQCSAHYAGCSRYAGASWTCQTEGVRIEMCAHCYSQWRMRAASNPRLAARCPRCADLLVCADASGAVAAPDPSPPRLSGAAADAIDRALHMEGVLPDVRERVLLRLAEEAPWLRMCDV